MLHAATLFLTVLLLQTTPSLDSASPKERLEAIDQLARPGRVETVAPLTAALKKEARGDVRAAIVAGFGRIGGPEVVPVLIESLGADLDKDVRLQVVDSLQRLYIPVEDKGSIRTIFNRVKSVFADSDRPFVQNPNSVAPEVKAALAESMQRDFVPEVRAASARALGSLKAKDQVPALISTLELPQNSEHSAVRLEAVESLGAIRDPAAGPALERAIRDSDRKITQAAILGIGLTGYKEARPLVENIFRTDTNGDTKRKALEAIALLRDPGTLALFESLLGHQDDYYREMAAEGLARIEHDPAVLKAPYEQEKKANVKNALAFALVSADEDQYINDLLNALTGRQAYQAEAYLFELGKFEGKLPLLHSHLRDSNPKIRAGVAKVLGDIGDPSSRGPIEALAKDDNADVVSAAIAALRKLTPQ